MTIHIGDRVFHRGTRKSGVVLTDPRAGGFDVRTDDTRVEIWSLADTVLDAPGATSPHVPGRGHVTDPRHTPLKGQTPNR